MIVLVHQMVLHAKRHGKHAHIGLVTHCNTLQHTATHCNALQHTACKTLREARTEGECRIVLQFVAVCDIDMLQCDAVCMRSVTENTCTC